MTWLENDWYRGEARCRPCQQDVDGNKRRLIACECLAQLRTENPERTHVFGKIHSNRAPQREPRNAGSKSPHEPVTFFLGRAINNVESLFQLFEESRDFFGRML